MSVKNMVLSAVLVKARQEKRFSFVALEYIAGFLHVFKNRELLWPTRCEFNPFSDGQERVFNFMQVHNNHMC